VCASAAGIATSPAYAETCWAEPDQDRLIEDVEDYARRNP
jgi:hypothetical protein